MANAAITPVEWRVRVDLAATFRLVDLFGWSDLTATHLSARAPDDGGDDNFLINPFVMLFDEITASALVKVTAEGIVSQFETLPKRGRERQPNWRIMSTIGPGADVRLR